jgi:hypothetical protein
MNKKQKVLTVLGLIVLVILAIQYCSASHSVYDAPSFRYTDSGPNSEDLGIFIVSGTVLGAVYTGLFFVFKK